MDPTTQHFLLVHNDYHVTWIGLFCGLLCIDSVSCDNKQISKSLCSALQRLLEKNNLSLKECSFLAANQGPGPFTTVRVIIASLNGLAFATQLPIVGVNCIKTLTYEYADQKYDYVIALTNAFCNDVYFGILDTQQQRYSEGCMPFDQMLAHLQTLSASSLKFVGFISEEQKSKLIASLSNETAIPHSYFEGTASHTASLDAMGKQAYRQWCEQNNVVQQLLPLYFKSSAPILGSRK